MVDREGFLISMVNNSRLTIIGAGPIKEYIRKSGQVQRYKTVLCKCICGNEKHIRIDKLKETKSCGCLQVERTKEVHTIHGGRPLGKKSKTYNTWQSMKKRCLNPKDPSYNNYGGRGITICKEWLEFINFQRDMGERPKDCTLGRINNELGYFPGNCRWETPKEQALNRRETKVHARKSTIKFSPYRGVSWNKVVDKWQGKIRIEGKQISVGYFTSDEEAYKACQERFEFFKKKTKRLEIV